MAAAAERETVDDLFRTRMTNCIAWLVRELPLSRKKEVVASVDVPQLIIALARGTPSMDLADSAISEKVARTIEFKRDLCERAGGVLTVQQVRALLEHKSTQAVHKAVADGRLLALDDNGRKLFPAFQFDGRSVLPAIRQLLAATPTTSGWALLQFLVEGDEGLEGDDPLSLVKGGDQEVARLVRFAGKLES